MCSTLTSTGPLRALQVMGAHLRCYGNDTCTWDEALTMLRATRNLEARSSCSRAYATSSWISAAAHVPWRRVLLHRAQRCHSQARLVRVRALGCATCCKALSPICSVGACGCIVQTCTHPRQTLDTLTPQLQNSSDRPLQPDGLLLAADRRQEWHIGKAARSGLVNCQQRRGAVHAP